MADFPKKVIARTNTPWWQRGAVLTVAREYRGDFVIPRRTFGFVEDIYHPASAFTAFEGAA